MLITLAVTVYVTVLVAELVGDKTLYTVGTLATTHHVPPVLVGAGMAVALKMLAAVLLGKVIGDLPPLAISIVSACTFVAMAANVWFSKPAPVDATATEPQHWMRGFRAAFLSIFLTEWADFGQLTAAALVAQYGRPWTIWVFASLAMFTKVAVAAIFGIGIRRWIPRRVVRVVTTAVCLLMAVLAALRID